MLQRGRGTRPLGSNATTPAEYKYNAMKVSKNLIWDLVVLVDLTDLEALAELMDLTDLVYLVDPALELAGPPCAPALVPQAAPGST